MNAILNLNRTRLECKVVFDGGCIRYKHYLNRTRLECKEFDLEAVYNVSPNLNRTRLECKGNFVKLEQLFDA